MNGNLVIVVKDGEQTNIAEGDLREGDIVVFQVGDIAPADLRLVEANGLEVDEFEITGEILPVTKKVDHHDAMIYMGSKVTRGTGKGIVVATGEQTEFGGVLKQEWELNKPYPLHWIKLQYFILIVSLLPAFVIGILKTGHDLALTGAYFVLSIFLIFLQNNEFFRYLLISTELKNEQRKKIQVCDVRAIELFNRIDLVCFDKTGVLTSRKLDVKNIYFVDRMVNPYKEPVNYLLDQVSHILKLACALCNDVYFYEKLGVANPIDKALISFAEKNGFQEKAILSLYQRIYDQPFDSENRYMACGFETQEKEIYYFAKGDPDVILRMCDCYLTSTGEKKKTDFTFWSVTTANTRTINQNGDTAIALAYATRNPDTPPKAYTFLCLLQLENSLQPGVREVIQGLQENGIRSILLTGDRAETAARVGTEAGITQDTKVYLTGGSINRMDLAEVARQASYCSIFARLLPSQKGSLIRLLQQRNHCVAMLGDGSNDGIALKVADIGISFVKNSSPIARRLSKVLINDLADLLTLVTGAKRIKKSTYYLQIFRYLLVYGSLLCIYGWIFTLK